MKKHWPWAKKVAETTCQGRKLLYNLRGELELKGNRKSCENDLANIAEQQLSHLGRGLGVLKLFIP